MQIDHSQLVCRNPDCRVSETGKCVEGFEIEKCPKIGSDTAVRETPPTDVSAQPPEDITLPRSERLSLEEASTLARAVSTIVVAIIGPTSSGKTSLIASLCDLYQLGPIGALQFAAGRTFFAFEQACHDARGRSLRNVPVMEHTPLGSGVGFYHLALKNNTIPSVRNLLMADRNGEDYRSVTDDTSASAVFYEVHRANVITMLVNGELLLNVGGRHHVKHEVGMILQGLVDGGAIKSNPRVALVLTKFDTIARAPTSESERAERDFATIHQAIIENFGELFAQIQPFKIAASPSEPDCEYGYGVAELLAFWMAPSPVRSVPDPILPRSARAMSRFTDIKAERRS